MKYTDKNPPLQLLLTNSTCYKGTGRMKPCGVLIHDTGAVNPNLKRYVQPADDDPNRSMWLEMLGKNQYNNDYNHAYRKMGVNCWVGMLADGTVTTIQTLPWDYRPWGCGSGKNGSCNNGWLQFEICMGRKTDKEYFDAAYREACEITAFLCKQFNLDPYGTVDFKGMKVPVILCHADSHKLGLGSNHGDIYSYFGLFGKDMDTFQADVAALLADTHEAAPVDDVLPTRDEKDHDSDEKKPGESCLTNEVYVGDLLTEKRIWERLLAFLPNPYAVAGIMGNMMAESGLRSNNLQGSKEKTLDMTDEQYTAAVDDGSYSNFVHDGAGYGLFQATYWSIKEGLLSFAREKGVSISDCDMQADFFLSLMQTKEYRKLWAVLTAATSVREASDAVLTMFERPKDQGDAAKEKRAAFGEQFYEKYAEKPTFPYLVRITDTHLNYRVGPSVKYRSRGYIKPGTYTIVDEKDGFGLLKAYAEARNGWIMLKYTERKK